jgi:peptidyl-prolyl cis-trans isomerase D
VIDGPFGPVILLVRAIEPEVVRPLDAVRDEVRQTLALEAANAKVTEAYTAITDALNSGALLPEALQQAGVSSVTVPPVDRAGTQTDGTRVADLPSEATLLPAVFSAEPGADVTPVNFDGNSYVFFDLGEITEARDRKMDEVTDRVTADWKRDEAQRLVEERARALSDRVRGGEAFATMAEVEGLTLQTANSVTRESGPAVLGQAGTRAAFSGPQGTVAHSPALASGEALVLQVAEVAAPVDPASNVAANVRASLDETVRDDLYQSYIARLQKGTSITYNPGAIDQAKVGVR